MGIEYGEQGVGELRKLVVEPVLNARAQEGHALEQAADVRIVDGVLCEPQAAGKALARSANREAPAYLDQALSALAHLPESREAKELAIEERSFELHYCGRSLSRMAFLDELRRSGFAGHAENPCLRTRTGRVCGCA